MSKVVKVIQLLHSHFRVEYADGTSRIFARGAPIPTVGVDYSAPPAAPPPPEEILKKKRKKKEDDASDV